MKLVSLPETIAERLRNHARRNRNVEVCGLISEQAGSPRHVYAIRNIATDPRCFYEMDPTEQIHAMKTMRENGESLFAIYHSHPNGLPHPSATDIEQVAYRDAVHIIITIDANNRLEINGYYLKKNRIEAIHLNIL
jgi:proteasome lid subunit RPN8/RPN11